MSAQFQKIKERVEEGIRRREFPGCVIGVVSRSGERAVYPFGHVTYGENVLPVAEDTIYDLASVTKSIPGAALMMHLLDRRKIHLDDPLVRYVPAFGNLPGKDEVTLRHLLSYTLDLDVPPLSSLREKTPQEILSTIIAAPLKSQAGVKYRYANSTALFFHLIIEKVTGTRVDQLAHEIFFEPLKMKRTSFFPLKHVTPEQIAPTEILDWRGGEVRGTVHDESTYALQQGGIIPAVAGLFSTVDDLLNFAEMLLSDGGRKDGRIFSADIVRAIYNQPLAHGDPLPELGWERGEQWMGKERLNVFGKRGFTGTAVAVHPQEGKAVVILSNATYPERPMDGGRARHAFRRDILDIVFGND